jgi:hypothetical protein
VQADADHADSEGKVIEATGNHDEWKKCTANRSLIMPDGEVITPDAPVMTPNGKNVRRLPRGGRARRAGGRVSRDIDHVLDGQLGDNGFHQVRPESVAVAVLKIEELADGIAG